MLANLRSVIRTSRKIKDPAIQKWEGVEQHAVALGLFGITLLIALVFIDAFFAQLTLLGGFIGLLICAAYYFVLVTNMTAAAVTSLLVALVGAAVAAMHIALPLWVILLNGFGGTVLVIGLIAAWTRQL
jgi:hypothetical protein